MNMIHALIWAITFAIATIIAIISSKDLTTSNYQNSYAALGMAIGSIMAIFSLIMIFVSLS